MREICDTIKEHVGEIVAGWELLVREQPWIDLPPDHRIDNLPDSLIGMAEAALCRPTEMSAHRKCVAEAVAHGSARRKQGFPDSVLFSEYHLLRQALWSFITHRFGSDGDAALAIMRIDAAITITTNASLLGYYGREIRQRGEWDAKLERLVELSPFLPADPPRGEEPGGG